MVARGQRVGIDLTLLTGFLRFNLKWMEQTIHVFCQGHGLSISQPTISLHSIECLLRWQMFCEERLLHLAPQLRPYVLQVDGTTSHGGPVTLRMREAKSGITLFARQIIAESFEELVPALVAFKIRFGDPGLIVRDDGVALKKACEHVFPGVPQQLDHFHFLLRAGEHLLMEDHEGLKRGLCANEGMFNLADWSRKLPVRARTPEEAVEVIARLAAEWIEGIRSRKSSVPFHLPYYEAWRKMGWLLTEIGTIVLAQARGNGTLNLGPLLELRRQLEKLLSRPTVQEHGVRLFSLVPAFEQVRWEMRVERDRRSQAETVPLTEAEIARVKSTVVRLGKGLREKGDSRLWELWERLERKFEEQESYLWVNAPVPGLTRSTGDLERDHRRSRTGVRHRRGQSDTGEEMEHLGSLLAYWENLTNPWFIEHMLTGVNLRKVFACQDPGEIQRRRASLPWEGRRPCVRVSPKCREGALRKALAILKGTGNIGEALAGWVHEESLEVSPAV